MQKDDSTNNCRRSSISKSTTVLNIYDGNDTLMVYKDKQGRLRLSVCSEDVGGKIFLAKWTAEELSNFLLDLVYEE